MGANARRHSGLQRGGRRVEYTPVILVERRRKGERSLLYELKDLAEAAGYVVVDVVSQVRDPDPKYNIGAGKVAILAELVRSKGAKKVIFFNELKPHQAYNLMKELKVEVIDRFDLILEIFSKRAGSKEAKLQIELAKLSRELSFAREWLRLAKIGELHGFLGGGEYAIDTYYKHVRRRIAKIKEELAKLRARKAERWRRRSIDSGLYYLALTGYTGAGKTTLFNALTGQAAYVDGKPFATLSTKMGRAIIENRPVIVSDTVGFIDCLPPQLLDAFYTTLGEVVLADLVLLIYDASEEPSEIERKLTASLTTLQSLGVDRNRVLAVANKVDLISDDELHDALEIAGRLGLEPIAISARTGFGLDALKRSILDKLPNYTVAEIELSTVEDLSKLSKQVYIRQIIEDDGRVKAIVEGREEWLRAFISRLEKSR
ncbi:MAG: GTPase HflX [Thermofilaceae archaeon]